MLKAFILLCSGLTTVTGAVAQTAPLAPVEETALARDTFATGLLDRSGGALAEDLWRGADAQALSDLLENLPSHPVSPSIGVAARRVLLSPGESPQGADAALGGEKLKALVRLGFVDEAREIESLAIGGKSSAATLEAMATADLLSGDNAAACAKVQRIASPNDGDDGAKLRAFCYAVAGELDAADLALGLLRERGRLSVADEDILAPLMAGGKPKAGAEPIDAVHLAALRYADATLSYSPGASAGVHRAIATDGRAALSARLSSARRAAAMGVMSGAALKNLFGEAPLDISAVAAGIESFTQRPDDPVALAAAYQSARSKSAPEFARDRAALVAGAVFAARDFDTLFLLAALFADDVRSFEGMLVSSREANAFALSRFALGDIKGAEAWLGAGAASGLPSADASDVPALLAAAKAGRAGAGPNQASGAISDFGVLAIAVDAVIEAVGERIAGQGALAAIAASSAAASGDPVANVVVSRGLAVAGLEDLVRRRDAEQVLQRRFQSQLPQPVAAATPSATNSASPAPRVKPAPPR